MGDRPDLLLGIDAGTSVVKAALFTRQGEELAVVRRPTTVLTPRSRWSEASMTETWDQAADAIRELVASSGIGGERVAAVGLTGNMVGAWLVDRNGQPLRNAILWNDGRTQPLIDHFERGPSGLHVDDLPNFRIGHAAGLHAAVAALAASTTSRL